MLNKKMIEKFKKFENDVNNCDVFEFYTFNEFINCYFELCYDEYKILYYENKQKLINEYHCNNDNTIVLLYNRDDDEYLIINFEHDVLIITQNIEIECINDDVCKNALYDILQYMFTNTFYN